ncbi:hypothetical protein GCM10027063_10220 [Promicromonospora xylanilytica]
MRQSAVGSAAAIPAYTHHLTSLVGLASGLMGAPLFWGIRPDCCTDRAAG